MPRGHGGGFHGIAWGFGSPRSAASGPRRPGSPVRGRGDTVTCCARQLPCAFTPPGAHSGPPLCSFCAEVTPCHVAPRVLGEAGLCSQGSRCFWGELPTGSYRASGTESSSPDPPHVQTRREFLSGHPRGLCLGNAPALGCLVFGRRVLQLLRWGRGRGYGRHPAPLPTPSSHPGVGGGYPP